MNRIPTWMFVVASSALSTACLAQVATSGVRYDADMQLRGGVPVQLNGAGTRYRGPFKVYRRPLPEPQGRNGG